MLKAFSSVGSLGVALIGALLAASASAGPVGVIDEFDDANLTEYTLTKILDQGTTSNIAFSSPSGMLEVASTGADGAEQVLFLRNDGFGLAEGEELRVDIDLTIAGAVNDLGIAVGATPTAGVREDYLFVSMRSATQVNSRGFIGVSEIGQIQNFGVDVEQLFISRPAASTFELGYYAGGARTVMRSEDVGANISIGDNVGFYADLREDGATIAGLDNLRIVVQLPGDVNDDGSIDLIDFGIIRDNLFDEVVGRALGDLTGDGLVDFVDYREWKDNAGELASQVSLFGGSVPEPLSFALAAIAGAAVVGASRRR
ncbi:hypothetical protein Mal64_06500 [Pseudobythopirellula maris]|uniref:Dockerin domain-containing protein n=1 Tax=Pseudobythopirellula maris TaxID=2527991 RepID=A0A5C5ZT81_9BACT|nr:hypothetical protein [Pseudobythopirellula maris]TWT90265.1 hypothetical protein Mal64_06500 [Pseudobythopirellula maris]